jgi:adenine-specific DNA methylase
MCLITDSNKFKIAEEDITCYKAAVSINETAYRTPMRQFYFELGKTYEDTEKFYAKPENDTYIIEGGVFHSYVNLKDVPRLKKIHSLLKQYPGLNHDIIKCTIPKGTEYIEGFFGTAASYGSRAIRFEKNITPEL